MIKVGMPGQSEMRTYYDPWRMDITDFAEARGDVANLVTFLGIFPLQE